MGNSSTVQSLQVFRPSYTNEWKQQSSNGHCLLVRNNKTGILAEQYSVPLDNRISKEQNYWIYEMRRMQTDNIVTVYQIEKQGNQYICQGLDYLRVRTQYIPYRLSEISNISFSEALYILKEALIGFRAITDFYGSVRVTDQMIGFTPEHKVKVWLNQNFAENLPVQGEEFQFRQPSSLEQRDPHTISLIFDVIEEHVSGGKFPDGFSKAYREYPIQTFSEAIQFIQEYSSKQRIEQREFLVKQVTFINDKSIISTQMEHQIPMTVIHKAEPQRYLIQDAPIKRYFVQSGIQRSQLVIEKPQQQTQIQQIAKNINYKPRIISYPSQNFTQKQLQHQNYIHQTPLILENPSVTPVVKHYQKPFRKSQIVLPKQSNFNHQFISTINYPTHLHSQIQSTPHHTPTHLPTKHYISQSQLHIKQPFVSAPILNQKQSVTTVHSQSSLISNNTPVTINQQHEYSSIPSGKDTFIKKPKNVTADSIPSKYLPKGKVSFLSTKK